MKTFDVRYAGLVHALLRGISSDRACSIDPQTACSLIPEMLRSGDEMLTGDCVDRNSFVYNGRLLDACVGYMVQVRLRQELPVEERCALLAGLEREYPALYDDVAAALKSGGSGPISGAA